jgi:2'-5' RNA ligase
VRAFVGLFPEPADAGALARLAAPLAAVPGLRPVPAERLHLTLAFLGEIDGAEADALAARLPALAAHAGPVTARTVAPLWLPDPGTPRVLALAVDSGGAVEALAERVRGATAHLRRPQRPFLAHLTLARVRGGRRPEGASPTPATVVFRCACLGLYASRRTAAGPVYEPVAVVALAGER